MIDGFDGNGMIGVTVIYLGVTLIGIMRAWGYPSASALDGWMMGHGLSIKSPARTRIASYLRRTRWIRTIGFLVGWNVPFVWMWITRSAYRMNEVGSFWWVLGFALGILIAELARPRTDRGRSATLEPRRLEQYLPRFSRNDMRLLAGIVTVLAVLGAVLPPGEVMPIEPAEVRNSVSWYIAMAAVAYGIIVGTRLLQEAIVRSRQSFDSLDETQADDAMRSTSVQGLAGLGYGGTLWVGAVMAWDLTLSTSDIFSGPLGLISGALAMVGFGMLVGFPRLNHRWTVRRAREA